MKELIYLPENHNSLSSCILAASIVGRASFALRSPSFALCKRGRKDSAFVVEGRKGEGYWLREKGSKDGSEAGSSGRSGERRYANV